MIGRWVALVLVAVTAGGVALAACSDDGASMPETAAFVDDRAIPTSDVVRLAESYVELGLLPEGEEQGEHDVEREALAYLIQTAFLENLADDLGVEQPSRDNEELLHERLADSEILKATGMRTEDFRAAERYAALSRAVAFEVFPRVEVKDERLRSIYRAIENDVSRSWRGSVMLALFTEEDRARAMVAGLGEEADFAEAARSNDADRVGNFEITPLTNTPDGLDAVLQQLEAGETSDAFSYGTFWVVARLDERTALGELTFESLRQDLLSVAEDRARREQFDRWFTEQIRAADVSVDEYFGAWDPSTLSVKEE